MCDNCLPLLCFLRMWCAVTDLLPNAGVCREAENCGNLGLLLNPGLSEAFAVVYLELGKPVALEGRLCSEFLQTDTSLLVNREKGNRQIYHNWTFLFFMQSHG